MPKISQIDGVPCQAEVRILQKITLKVLSRKRKSGIVLRVGHLRTVLKPLGRVIGVFVSPVLIPHSSQPLPNQFSC